MIFLAGALAGIGYLFFSSSKDDKGEQFVEKAPLFNLKDVSLESQGGGYKKDYDLYFLSAAHEFGVPFALLKAHALTESSLRSNAFLNENPTNRADRIGWASRGLMQILWWPGSERWAKYGYADKDLGFDGVRMFEPEINIRIAAQLVRDNIKASHGNVRDAINMYNTGKKESVFAAPNGYTDKVLKYYNQILG